MTRVFLLHAREAAYKYIAQRGVDQLRPHAARLLVSNNVNSDLFDNHNEVAPEQKVLAARFQEVTSAYRDYTGHALDPRQVVRAHYIAAWRYLHGLVLDDAEFDALCDDIEREVLALKFVCDPDD